MPCFCAFEACACIWLRLHMCITPFLLCSGCCYVLIGFDVTSLPLSAAALSRNVLWMLLYFHRDCCCVTCSFCCAQDAATSWYQKNLMIWWCINGVWPKDNKILQKFWRTSSKQLVRKGEENAQQRAVGQVRSTTWSSNNPNQANMT